MHRQRGIGRTDHQSLGVLDLRDKTFINTHWRVRVREWQRSLKSNKKMSEKMFMWWTIGYDSHLTMTWHGLMAPDGLIDGTSLGTSTFAFCEATSS